MRGALDAHAARQGCARDRADAPRGADLAAARTARAMERTRPGWYEYQVEAELVHEFLRHGAQAVAYPSIVASGPNACVLHYRDNNRQMQRRRAAADRRRLRVPGLRVRHHAHVPGQRPVQRAAEGRSTSSCSPRSSRASTRCKPGRRIPRLSQGRRARARAGLIDLGLIAGAARRGRSRAALQAVLHAPRRPLARHGRARRRPLPGQGRVA